jgi:hypothetical protein
MAYDELTIYAIQDTTQKAFVERYRLYSSKAERDRTFKFLMENGESHKKKTTFPVKLRIIVKTEEDNQISMDLKEY